MSFDSQTIFNLISTRLKPPIPPGHEGPMDPRGRRLQRGGARSLLRQRRLPAAGFGQGNGENRPHAVDHVLRTRQPWGETWGDLIF